MQYKPHEYQQYATRFILDHPVAAILLDMGLGKSVITLTAIKQLIQEGKGSPGLSCGSTKSC
jgi:SNF2 family DNA or RNA helicase